LGDILAEARARIFEVDAAWGLSEADSEKEISKKRGSLPHMNKHVDMLTRPREDNQQCLSVRKALQWTVKIKVYIFSVKSPPILRFGPLSIDMPTH
jgi:hypothetical protein